MSIAPRHNRIDNRPNIVPFNPAEALPPQNIDAERCVLCAILLDPSHGGGDQALDQVIDVLRPEDFFREAHSVIYRGLLVLRGSGKPADLCLLIDELERQDQYERIGGDDLLPEIMNAIGHAKNLAHHADVVRQKSEMRLSIQAAKEVISRAYSNTNTSRQVYQHGVDSFERIAEAATARGGDEEEWEIRDYPDPLADAAFHGSLGALVQRVAPYTEASPTAILMQALVAFGNICGRAPHWIYGATKHHANLYLCVVGSSATGYKGTGWDFVGHLGPEIDDTWKSRIARGVNSGEACVEMVADERAIPGGGVIEGVDDKRLFLLETEFARLLSVFTRQGDSLSVIIRQFWDSGDNASLSRKNPISCTGAHASIVAHVTPEELNARLSIEDVANGVGNRFLWCWSVQSQELPTVVRFDWRIVEPMIADLCASLAHVRARERDYATIPMFRTARAEELWRAVQPQFKEPRPGHLGTLLKRGRPIVMRLAMIYALIDRAMDIDVPHLEAALAIWNYAVDTVVYVFSDRLGDPKAKRVIDALREAGDEGITQNTMRRNVFVGRPTAAEVAAVLNRMVQAGAIHRKVDASKGRTPVTTWHLGPLPPPRRSARSARSEIPAQDDRPNPIF